MVPNVLDASRRVIERNLLDRLEPAQHPLALLHRRRVRIDLFDLAQAGARMRDQIVFDAQQRFGDYIKRMPRKQIEILINASGKGIFNGNNGKVGALFRRRFEDVFKNQA